MTTLRRGRASPGSSQIGDEIAASELGPGVMLRLNFGNPRPTDHGRGFARPSACALGLEGIVSKRRDARYRSGRSLTWLKIKNPDYARR